jgi:hypothetical protein
MWKKIHHWIVLLFLLVIVFSESVYRFQIDVAVMKCAEIYFFKLFLTHSMLMWVRNVPWWLGMVNVYFLSQKFCHCCKDKFVMSREKSALPQMSRCYYDHVFMIMLSTQKIVCLLPSPLPALPWQCLCIKHIFYVQDNNPVSSIGPLTTSSHPHAKNS